MLPFTATCTVDVAKTHGNMSLVYARLSDFEKALADHSKAYAVAIAVCGADSPLTTHAKYHMAAVHKRRGEHEEAKQLYLECEAIFAKVLGPGNIKTTEAARQARQCDDESAAKAKEVSQNPEIFAPAVQAGAGTNLRSKPAPA
jgi:hypothetical protein